jgi:uncharacterized membrane protein
MTILFERRYSEAIYPFHALLLAGTVPLFLGATLADLAYAKSFHIQWSNFASWLIVGGLIFAGIALVFAIVDLCRAHRRASGIVIYTILLLVTWVLGFINALVHAKDAWAIMPEALILSIVVTVLACIAAWFGFSTPRIGGSK